MNPYTPDRDSLLHELKPAEAALTDALTAYAEAERRATEAVLAAGRAYDDRVANARNVARIKKALEVASFTSHPER